MALQDLIARLEQEAQSQVQAIQLEADAEVRAIATESQHAVADLTARHLECERAGRQIAHQRTIARAQQEARAAELEARHTMITRVLQRARALVPEAAASRAYLEALPAHVDEALSYFEGLHPRLRCQAAFASVVQRAIARHPDAELVVDETVGPGVVADSADGSLTVDATLASRLTRTDTHLAIELSRRLADGVC